MPRRAQIGILSKKGRKNFGHKLLHFSVTSILACCCPHWCRTVICACFLYVLVESLRLRCFSDCFVPLEVWYWNDQHWWQCIGSTFSHISTSHCHLFKFVCFKCLLVAVCRSTPYFWIRLPIVTSSRFKFCFQVSASWFVSLPFSSTMCSLFQRFFLLLFLCVA